MALSTYLVGMGVAIGSIAVYYNLPKSKPVLATIDYLAKGKIYNMDGDKEISGSSLWKDGGAVIMAEATRLSSLKPDLDALGVRLAAVVHERTGVSGFKPYFAGDIYWDKNRHFYGPHKRWASVGELLRLDVLSRAIDMYKKGVDGNLKGEGRLLGGCFVIGPGEQGILYQHQENSFGDTSNTTEVLEAVKKIIPSKL